MGFLEIFIFIGRRAAQLESLSGGDFGLGASHPRPLIVGLFGIFMYRPMLLQAQRGLLVGWLVGWWVGRSVGWLVDG